MSFRPNNIGQPTLTWFNSITVRLTVLILISTALVLFLTAGVMISSLYHSIRDAENQFMLDTASVIEEALRSPINDGPGGKPYAMPLLDTIDREVSAIHFSKLELLMTGADNHILLKTQGFENLPPLLLVQRAKTAPKDPNQPSSFSNRGRDYLMLVRQVSTEATGLMPIKFYLVLDITENNQLIASYRDRLFSLLIAGVMIAAFLAYAVTAYGLLPLREMNRAVQSIQPSRLNKRIHHPKWPVELQQLSSTFDRMMDGLEKTFEQMSQFTADVAHEFRTPLANLKGMAEVTLTQSRSEEEYREVLISQLEEFDRLSVMVDKLLFLSRAENMEAFPHASEFYAGHQIQTVLEYFGPVLEEHRITVTVEGNALLWADLMMFRRVISNLVSNAIKHLDDGGNILIEMHPQADLSVNIQIRDTGHGIPPDHLPRIFDRFYQVEESRNAQPGSGLGLSIVQMIMTLHRGTIQIDSEPGQGTVVTLNFPMQKAKSATTADLASGTNSGT